MNDKNRIIKEIGGWIFSLFAAFIIVILLNNKVFAKVQVQQSSMENTLLENQQLIIDKLSYNFSEPKRGDIIIFLEYGDKRTLVDDALRTVNNLASIFGNSKENIEESSRLVKRVIGVAGDEVDIRDGYVYVNGEKLEEPYIKGETLPREFKLPIKVGENKLFVLGDNREVSKDSRNFGLIDCSKIEGKAIFRVYPFNKMGKVK